MGKLTVNEIKKQIAALEAKAARIAEDETKAAVGKVRALMNQLGVTLEHLSSAVSRKGAAVKKVISAGRPATSKRAGKGVAKYRDPQTGATWTGFGRAPGWIAGVVNRDAFLVSSGAGHAPETGTSASAAKKRAGKKVTAKKPVAKKVSAKKATATQASAKKATKPAVKRAAAKKAASKAVAAKKPKVKSPIKAAATKAVAKKAAKKKAAFAAPVAAPAAADNSETSEA